MLRNALLTKRSKSIFSLVDATPLLILLPRTRDARHRVLTVSSSLGQGPPGLAQILLPCVGPYLDLASALSIRLQLRLEPLFFARQQICMADLPIARLCPPHRRAIVPATAAYVVPAPPRSAVLPQTPGPTHPLGWGLFIFPIPNSSDQTCPAISARASGLPRKAH